MNLILEIIILVFWFIIILVPLVVIHEFGHYLMSKMVGVKIPEFAIGFPLTKKWFAKKFKGTIWSFYPVLIGGFVRIWGDNDAIDEASEVNKTDPKKAKENYVQDRFQELISLRELAYFLNENNIEYDQSWKDFENSKFAQGKEEELGDEKKEKYEKKFNQLATLIEWEFDKEMQKKNAFFNKSWLQQTLIISGGVIFNFLAAIGIFWFMFSFMNLPLTPLDLETYNNFKPYIKIQEKSEHVKVQAVAKDSPLAKTGFTADDQLISIQNRNLEDFKSQTEVTNFLQTLKDKEIQLSYLKSENNQVVNTNLRLQEKDGRYFLGVAGNFFIEVKYTAKSPLQGLNLAILRTGQITGMSFKALGDLVTSPFTGRMKEASQSLAGPIAVSKISSRIFEIAQFSGILEMMALISISLAVFNILPIPALDGGRFIILTINKLTGKRNKKIEATIISITFFTLLILSAFIALRDINGIIEGRFG
jgi:regulator of sigma E protease